jgi:hypothetical protein
MQVQGQKGEISQRTQNKWHSSFRPASDGVFVELGVRAMLMKGMVFPSEKLLKMCAIAAWIRFRQQSIPLRFPYPVRI